MRRWGAIAALVLAASVACAATGDDANPSNTLPAVSPDANSYSRTRTFLKSEDADRYYEQFYGFVYDGCTHPVPGSGYVGTLSSPCMAYAHGYRVYDTTASINYQTQGASSTDVCWVAVTAAASGNSGNFVRVSGTHFTVDCTSATLPSQPSDGIIVLKTTITAGSISVVQERSRHLPYDWTTTRAVFSALVLDSGDIAFASDTGCLYLGDGTTTGGVLIGCGTDVIHTCTDVTTCISASSNPYDVVFFRSGSPTDAQVVWLHRFNRAVSFAANFSGSYGKAVTASTGTATYSIKRSTNCSVASPTYTEIGTEIFTTSKTATFTTTGAASMSFSAGDCIEITAPATSDATLADVGTSLAGTR